MNQLLPTTPILYDLADAGPKNLNEQITGTSNVNAIKYCTIWALMLKIKLKHTDLLDFVSRSLFCLGNGKLSWNLYWHKNSSYKCIYILALLSRKLRLIESIRLTLSSVLVLGVRKFKHPWLLSKKSLYTLRTFRSNRILTRSIFSPVILNGYKFTN